MLTSRNSSLRDGAAHSESWLMRGVVQLGGFRAKSGPPKYPKNNGLSPEIMGIWAWAQKSELHLKKHIYIGRN